MNPSIGAISKWKYLLQLKPWCAYLHLETSIVSLHIQDSEEVQGFHTSQYFIAKEGQLFYEFKGSQNLPIQCSGLKVYLSNVKDILLLRENENSDNKFSLIKPQEVANIAELRSLSFHLR